MATAKQIIDKAASYIGVCEKPAGSNNVIFNTDYYGREVSGKDYAWCCAFVWDIFRMCGASDLFYGGKKTAYCPTAYNWAKKEKLLVGKANGQTGDVVFFDWDKNGVANHIGFIKSKNADGTYQTIEGNTSKTSDDNGGKVMERCRPQSSILDIYRPKYAKDAPVIKEEHKEEIFVAEKTYKNTSGKTLDVFADTTLKEKIGTLYVNSTCKCLGVIDGRALLKYKVVATGAYKVGFTSFTAGVGK